MKKYFLPFVVFVFSAYIVDAQEQENIKVNNSTYVHNIGGFAGASGGLGLSYRYFGKKFGVQIASVPIIGSSHTYLSLGLTAMMSINQGKYTRLYSYIGNHYLYERDSYENYTYDYDTGMGYYSSTETYTNKTNITGVGLGFEVVAGQRVGFNFQFGYAFYYRGSDDWNTMLDGGIGIFYKF